MLLYMFIHRIEVTCRDGDVYYVSYIYVVKNLIKDFRV